MEKFIQKQLKFHPNLSPAELIYGFYRDVNQVNKNLMTYRALAQKWHYTNKKGEPMGKLAWLTAHRLFEFVVVMREKTMDDLKFKITAMQWTIDESKKIYDEFDKEIARTRLLTPGKKDLTVKGRGQKSHPQHPE